VCSSDLSRTSATWKLYPRRTQPQQSTPSVPIRVRPTNSTSAFQIHSRHQALAANGCSPPFARVLAVERNRFRGCGESRESPLSSHSGNTQRMTGVRPSRQNVHGAASVSKGANLSSEDFSWFIGPDLSHTGFSAPLWLYVVTQVAWQAHHAAGRG